MQGTTLRSQLRTNTPGHTAIVGEVTYNAADSVPSVLTGSRFRVGQGVYSFTKTSTPAIASAPDAVYANVPVTTASGSTALCSLTVAGGSGVISDATVTAPGYDYTAGAVMSVVVGSLFWASSVLVTGLTGLTASTYYVALSKAGNVGTGMIAKVVTSTTAITAVTVNPSTETGTALGSNYGTSAIIFDLPAGALYVGSPAIASAFTLTPNAGITGGSWTPIITGNCSIIFANKVVNVVSAVATPIVSKPSNTPFFMVKRFDGPTYVNFGTFSATNTSATPAAGDGFCFNLVATDTSVTA